MCRLSIRLSWPFTQLGGSDATKHTRKAKGFHAAGELIRLSAHLSLHFAFPVDSPVVDCLKLFRLSARLSHMFRRQSCCLSWPFTQLGGSDANNHMPKAGYFHAAGELIRLSARLSRMLLRLWEHLSYRLSRHDMQHVQWRLAAFNPAQVAAAEVSAR